MRGQEVDAGPMPAALLVEEIARAGDARGKLRRLPFVALPEPAHGIAIAVVPLRPARGEVADLIAAHADVPRLGDQLDPLQRRVLQYSVQEIGRASCRERVWPSG